MHGPDSMGMFMGLTLELERQGCMKILDALEDCSYRAMDRSGPRPMLVGVCMDVSGGGGIYLRLW